MGNNCSCKEEETKQFSNNKLTEEDLFMLKLKNVPKRKITTTITKSIPKIEETSLTPISNISKISSISKISNISNINFLHKNDKITEYQDVIYEDGSVYKGEMLFKKKTW